MGQERSTRHTGLSRRTFLRYSSTGVGLLVGAGPLLASPREAHGRRPSRPGERRRYLFDLSHLDTTAHDLVLVAGKQRVPLEPVSPAVLSAARRDHPILSFVADDHLTHQVAIRLPADGLQLCYLQRIARGTHDGSWDMVLLFYHHPIAALREAWRRAQLGAGSDLPPVPVKWESYGVTPDIHTAFNDPVGEEMFHDSMSHAIALVAGHPELASLEANSAAHIQNNIIATQPSTRALGLILNAQGAHWATQTPLIDPDTHQPYKNSHHQNQYVPVWSETTSRSAGPAISSALETVKNDTSLGANITDIPPTTIAADDPDAPTKGVVWTLHDGRPSVDQSSTSAPESGLSYMFTDRSPGHGYSVEVKKVDPDASGNRLITLAVKNWYVRHLGLWVRYLDAKGQPIPLRELPVVGDERFFPLDRLGFNGEFDAFLNLINPEWVALGIPVHTVTTSQTFPLPPTAASALILAGGLGAGDIPYPDTLAPGATMTIVFELAVPAILLALQAGAAYATLVGQLQNVTLLLVILQVVVQLVADLVEFHTYNNPSDFVNLGLLVGAKLLGAGANQLDRMIAAAIAEAESVTAVTDAVPVIGMFVSAIGALGLVVQLVETLAEVAQSPMTYVGEIVFTHDVEVTIFHDPKDPAGFPATAASYTVTAVFDNGTPHHITEAMPGGTVTRPILVTFRAVPAGGQVSANVGFYSKDGFLVGKGSVGPVANTPTVDTLKLTITIEELLVPLTAHTTYRHKELIVLDAQGRHHWQATTTPPAVVTPGGQCEDLPGQICSLAGITVSTIDAAVGYAWQAYSRDVTACGSGGPGQLHQFANLSIAETPESGRLFSGCGFGGTVRVVYDLMGNPDRAFYLDPTLNPAVNRANLIRQIRLRDTPPSYDGPGSNRAWGSLRFASDALLLHPQGKIVSLNTSAHKLEVLELPPAAVPDAHAPQSQVYSGIGSREGLMNGPVRAALTPQGTILVLESRNNRVQAFDLHGNPARHFAGGAYFVPLRDTGATYLDLAVEYSGYFYVLSYTGSEGSFLYRLDIYHPDGSWLARTTGVNADKLAVNYWRDAFTLNYQVLTLPDGAYPGVTEPSVSHWIPSAQ